MKLTKARTCEGCRALASRPLATYCELGFKTTSKTLIHGLKLCKPAEPCLKPKTIPEYFEAIEAAKNRNP